MAHHHDEFGKGKTSLYPLGLGLDRLGLDTDTVDFYPLNSELPMKKFLQNGKLRVFNQQKAFQMCKCQYFF